MVRMANAEGITAIMNGNGKSDDPIVPEKPANEGTQPSHDGHLLEESAEGRGSTKGNVCQPTADGMQGPRPASRGLPGIREAARRDRHLRFTGLLHHVTESLLKTSYDYLNPRATAGVDGVTWQAYGKELDSRVADLKDRLHSGRYRAQPSKRCFIPKPDGRQRPLGIASLEDKVAQQAVVTVLSQIYEEDFKGFNYGFRPSRSQHDALDALYVGLTERRIGWVLDADIQGFFDHLDHEWLLRFLEHRIGDPRVARLIRKWLRAGVSEEGRWMPTGAGTPQGAVISPLLANVYLHYVLDLWIDWWRKHVAVGEVVVVRYADDFVIGFQHERDARCCLEELRERFTRFDLKLHPEKTRLIEFGSFAAVHRRRRGEGKPESFDFLGFTHSCSRTRDGRFSIRRKTIAKRMRAKLSELKETLKRCRHAPIPEQGAWLKQVVQGWYNYYAVPYNITALNRFRFWVGRLWWKALRRRSQRAKDTLWWPRMNRIIARWLPDPKITHPWPTARFAVKHPR